MDSWHDRTIAVNSCTGQVVSDTTFYQWSYIYLPGVVVLVIVIIIVALKD